MKSWSYLRLVKGSIEKKLLFPVQNNESHPNLSLREYPGSSAESMLEWIFGKIGLKTSLWQLLDTYAHELMAVVVVWRTPAYQESQHSSMHVGGKEVPHP